MSFGLCNAGPRYQRMMDVSSSGLPAERVLAYMGDIVVFINTFEEHLQSLKLVFQKLRESNISPKLSKCVFATRKVDFWGFELSNSGIRPQSRLTDAISNFKQPAAEKELKGFLGLAGFYRAFIRDIAKIAEPLNRLTSDRFPPQPVEASTQPENPRGKFGRWIAEWEEFEYSIQYIPGRENMKADALSRNTSVKTSQPNSSFEDKVYHFEDVDSFEAQIKFEQMQDPLISRAIQRITDGKTVDSGRLKRVQNQKLPDEGSELMNKNMYFNDEEKKDVDQDAQEVKLHFRLRRSQHGRLGRARLLWIEN
eukprot:gene8309-9196_t